MTPWMGSSIWTPCRSCMQLARAGSNNTARKRRRLLSRDLEMIRVSVEGRFQEAAHPAIRNDRGFERRPIADRLRRYVDGEMRVARVHQLRAPVTLFHEQFEL